MLAMGEEAITAAASRVRGVIIAFLLSVRNGYKKELLHPNCSMG
jgi:hypothetical protein